VGKVQPQNDVPQIPDPPGPAGDYIRSQREKARKMREYAAMLDERALIEKTKRADALERLKHTFDIGKPAHQLSKDLALDNDQLWAVVNTPTIAVERRVKAFEVLMHRIGDKAMWSGDERWKEFRRNSLYALYNDPQVFGLLSKSTELVLFTPPGILQGTAHIPPATFVLKATMDDLSSAPGLLNRQRFADQVTAWPAETQGRFLYHLEDALRAGDGRTVMMRADFERLLASEYGKMTDQQKTEFKSGYTQAHDATNFPKDGTKPFAK
jgi:hypothetical protein